MQLVQKSKPDTRGAVAGVATAANLLLGAFAARGGHSFEMLEWLGYLIMIVALSVIFIAIKRYRDQELGGVIKFGRAVVIGLGVTLVAGLFYVVGWEISLALTDYAFIGDYTDAFIAEREAAGVNGAELEAVIADMGRLKTQYANPLFRLPMTFLEIFPVGALITLVSAGLLRNPKLLPAS